MSVIIYGIHMWELHIKPSIMRKVQSVQTNILKLLTGNYNGKLRELLDTTKWLSVHELAIYNLVLLYWKVKQSGKPDRLVSLVNISLFSMYLNVVNSLPFANYM